MTSKLILELAVVGRVIGLRQAQRMLKAVLERDTRREKRGD